MVPHPSLRTYRVKPRKDHLGDFSVADRRVLVRVKSDKCDTGMGRGYVTFSKANVTQCYTTRGYFECNNNKPR